MILLNSKNYFKLVRPLMSVPINTLFARSVIEQKVNGQIFVDNIENPQTYYVVHPYGMSLLFGDCDNMAFNREFEEYIFSSKRDKVEWIQAFPNGWNLFLNHLFESDKNRCTSIIEQEVRVNFKFNKSKYLKKNNIIFDAKIKINPTSKEDFKRMKGSVIPSRFWNNADDFLSNGTGYSLYYENKLASVAFSAFTEENTLELGIETCETFRGKGFAYMTCSALIDYCLRRNLEPIWACRLGNTQSYILAQKLGFKACKEIPYYTLKAKV